MNPQEHLHLVGGAEVVLRSVEKDEGVKLGPDGWQVMSQAFRDPAQEPSVDRSTLLASFDDSRKSPQSGVVSLRVLRIRNEVVEAGPGGADEYRMDVDWRPVVIAMKYETCSTTRCAIDLSDYTAGPPENLAHSVISVSPDFKTPRHFRKIRISLSILAEICLPPP